jgi:hypothetical protein
VVVTRKSIRALHDLKLYVSGRVGELDHLAGKAAERGGREPETPGRRPLSDRRPRPRALSAEPLLPYAREDAHVQFRLL